MMADIKSWIAGMAGSTLSMCVKGEFKKDGSIGWNPALHVVSWSQIKIRGPKKIPLLASVHVPGDLNHERLVRVPSRRRRDNTSPMRAPPLRCSPVFLVL